MSKTKANKIYTNKVFSYKNKLHFKKNFSRKDFSKSLNYRVIFRYCTFRQTIFNKSKFENCLFYNCLFENCSFVQNEFIDCTFYESDFSIVLFDRTYSNSTIFEKGHYTKITFNPLSTTISGLTSAEKNEYSEEEEHSLNLFLEKLKQQQYIRRSNTLFLKESQGFSKTKKKNLKKINSKEAKKLGISKNERLKRNCEKKLERNIIQRKKHQDALQGKNRKVSEGVLNHLKSLYTYKELIKGLEYARLNINRPFISLSFLLKYIDKGRR